MSGNFVFQALRVLSFPPPPPVLTKPFGTLLIPRRHNLKSWDMTRSIWDITETFFWDIIGHLTLVFVPSGGMQSPTDKPIQGKMTSAAKTPRKHLLWVTGGAISLSSNRFERHSIFSPLTTKNQVHPLMRLNPSLGSL